LIGYTKPLDKRKEMKELVDQICQPKVAALVGVFALVSGGIFPSTKLGDAGAFILIAAGIWAAAKAAIEN
jgi:hypothetical protein